MYKLNVFRYLQQRRGRNLSPLPVEAAKALRPVLQPVLHEGYKMIVTAFKAEDGRLFESQVDCERHNIMVRIDRGFEKYYKSSSQSYHHSVHAAQHFIKTNFDSIRTIIDEAVNGKL